MNHKAWSPSFAILGRSSRLTISSGFEYQNYGSLLAELFYEIKRSNVPPETGKNAALFRKRQLFGGMMLGRRSHVAGALWLGTGI